MAGMFYSLQEVIEKMQATKERIDELVRDGRLREFRDGPNLLFKVDEVEALMADTSFMTAEQPSPPEPQTDQEPLLVDLEPAETAAEPPELTEEDTIAVPGEEGIVPEEVEAAAEPIPEITADISGQEAEAAEEISLEPESAEVESSQKGLSDADTIIADEGTDLLSETDAAQETGDDLLGATRTESDQASLEQIEEDINLDTFGSGSGLLDLSLQADDTSLGGVLDEIYTSEGDEEKGSAEVPAASVAAEAEEIVSEEALPAPVATAQAYVEAQPDAVSNAFGIVLFVPLLVVIYTAIVVLAAFNGIKPFVLEQTKGIIWYIAIGLAVLAIMIIGVPFMLGGKAGTKAKPKVKAKAKTKKARNKKAAKPKANSESD